MSETAQIDALFLELAQFTSATTPRERRLIKAMEEAARHLDFNKGIDRLDIEVAHRALADALLIDGDVGKPSRDARAAT